MSEIEREREREREREQKIVRERDVEGARKYVKVVVVGNKNGFRCL